LQTLNYANRKNDVYKVQDKILKNKGGGLMNKVKDKSKREFLKKSLLFGAAIGTTSFLGKTDRLFASEVSGSIPDLVAVRNGEPDLMFNKAIEAMGGMKRFVKKGQTVVVKPNIGFDKAPEIGATTNPSLVKTIVEQCFHAGAKKVYVFDNVAASSYGVAKQCYETSGIANAAKSSGALVVQADNEKDYHEVNIQGAKLLNKTKIHELILESDVFINVPILKNHRHAHITNAMKNLMGIVWDRMSYHFTGLDQCIADFCLYKTPDLNVVDAYRVMMRNGPRGQSKNDVVIKKTLLMSSDIVAIDAAGAKIYGIEPRKIPYIKIGHDLKVGNINLNELKISRLVV
jgi:uncharacterized protein (DUF362 family)